MADNGWPSEDEHFEEGEADRQAMHAFETAMDRILDRVGFWQAVSFSLLSRWNIRAVCLADSIFLFIRVDAFKVMVADVINLDIYLRSKN